VRGRHCVGGGFIPKYRRWQSKNVISKIPEKNFVLHMSSKFSADLFSHRKLQKISTTATMALAARRQIIGGGGANQQKSAAAPTNCRWRGAAGARL